MFNGQCANSFMKKVSYFYGSRWYFLASCRRALGQLLIPLDPFFKTIQDRYHMHRGSFSFSDVSDLSSDIFPSSIPDHFYYISLSYSYILFCSFSDPYHSSIPRPSEILSSCFLYVINVAKILIQKTTG